MLILMKWLKVRNLHHTTLDTLHQFHKQFHKQPLLPLHPQIHFYVDDHFISSNIKTFTLWLNTTRFLLRNIALEQRIDILSCSVFQDPPAGKNTCKSDDGNHEYVQIRWEWQAIDKLLNPHSQEGISLFLLSNNPTNDVVLEYHLYFTNPPRMLFHLQS